MWRSKPTGSNVNCVVQQNMPDQTLTTGSVEYPLTDVLLHVYSDSAGADSLLIFDLLADCGDLTRAGFAINSMSAVVTTAHSLAQRVFELDEQDDDPYNELRESVVCRPGSVLELSHLKICFGADQGDAIDVKLEAQCFRLDPDTDEIAETDISVSGQFQAKRSDTAR
jgi:hypothetical protein